jgi:hypothetical protein
MNDKDSSRRSVLTAAGVAALGAFVPSAEAAQDVTSRDVMYQLKTTEPAFDPSTSGQLHRRIMDEFLEAEVGSAKEVMKTGIEKLQTFKLINPIQAESLTRIIDAITSLEPNYEKVIRACDDSINNRQAGAVVHAIAGIVKDSVIFMRDHHLPWSVVRQDVAGAVVGGVAGYRWGLLGVTIGILTASGGGSVIALAESWRQR